MPPARHLPPRWRAPLAAVAATVALTGCMTGPRPTLIDEPPVGDPAIQAVLERLDVADGTDFTATYDIIPSTTGVATEATVRHAGELAQVTIGDVDYVIDGPSSRTCDVGTTACSDGLDDARISDLNVTHRFWGDSFAARLRREAQQNIADGAPSTAEVAGEPATCVEVPVAGGTVTYCALDAGPLARYFGADVSIELTSFTPGTPAPAVTPAR